MLPQRTCLPPPPQTPPRSRFEFLPTETRLQIYILHLDDNSEYCHLERCENDHNYPIPLFSPPIASSPPKLTPCSTREPHFAFSALPRLEILLTSVRISASSAISPAYPACGRYLHPSRSKYLVKYVAAAPLEPRRKRRVGICCSKLHERGKNVADSAIY